MKQVTDFLKELLQKKDTVVVACSAGPDSMFLTHLLLKLRETKDLNIVIAHVNHNLRKQSQEEAEYMSKFCEDNNLKYEYLKIDKYSNNNFHNESRKIRYNFFEECVKKYNAKYLFTAHHGDDLVETILMRLTRGSSVRGYSGFRLITDQKGYKLVRPLIFMTKDQIKKYMDQNNLKYYIDESNAKDKYTRNRYRNHVLPFLKEEEKNIHLKYLQFSEDLIDIQEYVDKVVNNNINKVYDNEIINIEEAKKLDKFIVKQIISRVLAILYPTDLNKVNNNNYMELVKLVYSPKANSMVNLPNNITALKEYNSIRFIKNEQHNSTYDYVLDDSIDLPNGYSISKCPYDGCTSNYYLYLSSKDIKLPLHIRNRIDGDKMEVKNLKGHKKVKDILINEKINKSIRDQVPIVTDSDNNILWIPGIKKSKFDRAKTENYDIILKYYEKEGKN